MKLFEIRRMGRDERYIPAERMLPVARGVVFDSGKVVINWLGDVASVAVYDSIEACIKVHGHDGTEFMQTLDDSAAGELITNHAMDENENLAACVMTANHRYVWQERGRFAEMFKRVRMSGGGVALVTALVLLGLVALPAHAELPRLTDARTAQTSCVLREYRTRTASAGVSAREAALVARLGAEHACALEGWARALGGVDALAVATATRAPVLIERVGETTYMSRDRGLTWIDVLSHGGACALCGGGVALGAWAACGGAR